MSDHVTEQPTAPVRADIVPEAPPQFAGGTTPRKAMFIVFIVVFIDLLGFGIVLPLLPLYGDKYVAAVLPGADLRSDWRIGAIVGLLMSTFSLMQFVFAPLWGRVSDRVGRRPILLMGLVGSVVFYALFGYASDLSPETMAVTALTLLFIARAGQGVAGATIATAQAVIADCTTPEKRKHGMALIGAAFGIGFTFGPLIGFAALTWFPHHAGATGYFAAALSLLALLLGIFLLPETRRFDAAPPIKRGWLDLHAIGTVLLNPAVGLVVLIFFLATFGFGSFEVTLSLLNQDTLGLKDNTNFLVFAYVGFVLMMTQGLLYRRLANRVSETTFMFAGIILMAIGVACLGGTSWWAAEHSTRWALGGLLGTTSMYAPLREEFYTLLACVLVSLTFAVMGFALLTPSAQALISRRSDPARQGEVLGVNQSASALARILGPLIGVTLYKATYTHLLPYAWGAGLLVLMLPLMVLMQFLSPRTETGGTISDSVPPEL